MASQFPNEPNDGVPPPPPPPPPSITSPATRAGMIGRIQGLFLNTHAEWQKIDGEPTAARALFMSWAVPLAAIGPVATLIGFVLLVGSFLFTFALVFAIALYALFLASAWGLAMIVDGLAPNFGSTRSFDQAMKVSCYSFTAFWVAGVINVIPSLSPVAELLGLFGLFVMWIGLPIVMKTPADKAPGYVAVSGLSAVVLIFASYKIAEAIAGTVLRSSLMGGFGGM